MVNIGVLGLSGVGKTTYYLIWTTLLMRPGSIQVIDPAGDKVYDIIVDQSRIPITARTKFYNDAEQLLSGKCVSATPISEFSKIWIPIILPYRGKEYDIDLTFNDISGETFKKVVALLDNIAKRAPPENLRQVFLRELENGIQKARSMNDRATVQGYQIVREFLNTSFDGVILLLDKAQTKILDQVILTYFIRMIAEGRSSRRKVKFVVLYTKAAYYGVIDPKKIINMDLASLTEYYNTLTREAENTLKRFHRAIYSMFHPRTANRLGIELTGTYFYDAYPLWEKKVITYKDEFEDKEIRMECIIPKIYREQNVEYFYSFAPVTPFLKLIYSLL